MASKVNQNSDKDDIYTPQLIKKAVNKLCGLCNDCISESEANDKDFFYTKTKRGSEIFVHKHCWNSNYRS